MARNPVNKSPRAALRTSARERGQECRRMRWMLEPHDTRGRCRFAGRAGGFSPRQGRRRFQGHIPQACAPEPQRADALCRLETPTRTSKERDGAILRTDDECQSCCDTVRELRQGTNQVRHRPRMILCIGAHGSPGATIRTQAFTVGTHNATTAGDANQPACDLGTYATEASQRSPEGMAKLPSAPRQMEVGTDTRGNRRKGLIPGLTRDMDA